MAITIMIADDYSIVREGIKSVIGSLASFQIRITGEASDGKEMVQLAGENPADVYLIDLGLPDLDGIETASRLIKENGCTKTILFTMYRDKMLVQRAFEAGIKGYLLKESTTDELIEAIFSVYHGGTYITPSMSDYLRDATYNGNRHDSTEHNPLTERQREIFKLICDGLTERQIAEQLNISVNTVHVHKTNIMKELDIHTKTGLIKYGMRERLIPPIV